jgi:putative chitinase
MTDHAKFFTSIHASFGQLKQTQVEGFTNILNEWDRRQLDDERWLAYMLATVWHETATQMQPIREMGSDAYLRSKPYYPYIGEGLVQVTWKRNYLKFGATQPGQLLQWPLALHALFDGMIHGLFTGKELGDYFSMRLDDPIHARRIINGLDKAALIAGYYRKFLGAVS